MNFFSGEPSLKYYNTTLTHNIILRVHVYMYMHNNMRRGVDAYRLAR